MKIEEIENKIINDDCLNVLKQLPNNCIDLVVTSPPYNIGNVHHTGNTRHSPYADDIDEQEYQNWQIKVLNELARVLKNTASIFYNHKNRIKDGFTISPYEWILKTNLKIKQEITWKNGSQNFDKIRFYPMSEKIFWLSKKNVKINNVFNLSDVWDYNDVLPEKNNMIHKRAFSVKFARIFIEVASNQNDLVLDCFSGSGTTAIACSELKRRFICIEKDKQYYEASVKRLEDYNKQLKLF